MTQEPLSVAELVAEMERRHGPWLGDEPFLSNLERLIEAGHESAALNATGRDVLRKVALRHLRNGHAIQAHLDDHPDIATRPLAAPVVVTGLPRTGTTLLHNLLALDPAFRVLRFWEALDPVPGRATEAASVARAERWLDGFHGLVPAFRSIHRVTPTGPEECDALLQNSFTSQHFDDMFDAPRYSAWIAHDALTTEYRHYALQLRVLTGDAPEGTTWALKSPGHLGHLDALRDVFPGATIVMCHRRPADAVASYASLIHTLRGAYSDAHSVTDIGQQALRRAAMAMRRAAHVRADAGEAGFIDVAYDDLVRDPVRTVQHLYGRMGRSLAEEMGDRISTWVGANPRHGHGEHRYDLAGFGLTDAAVEAEFGPYLDRFGALAGA